MKAKTIGIALAGLTVFAAGYTACKIAEKLILKKDQEEDFSQKEEEKNIPSFYDVLKLTVKKTEMSDENTKVTTQYSLEKDDGLEGDYFLLYKITKEGTGNEDFCVSRVVSAGVETISEESARYVYEMFAKDGINAIDPNQEECAGCVYAGCTNSDVIFFAPSPAVDFVIEELGLFVEDAKRERELLLKKEEEKDPKPAKKERKAPAKKTDGDAPKKKVKKASKEDK